ncbi:hypothetical protein ABZP36_005884 [Zizania latifolia]
MGTGGEGAVPRAESGGRRRRRFGEDDDDDDEYVLEEENEEDLSASSAGEEGKGSDEEYDEDEEDDTPRPIRQVRGPDHGRKGKAVPAVVRSRRCKYEDDDDYLDELEEDEGVDEYHEDLEEEVDETVRSKRMKKCGGRSAKGKLPPAAERFNRRRYQEDMDFDPEMDEEEEEDVDFDPEVEEEEEDFEDEEEDELGVSHMRRVKVNNKVPRKSALNQRRGKKNGSSKVSSRKVSSVKARKAALVRRRQRKRSMSDHYEDDDFIVEDQVTVNRQPRKKARVRRQMEVDPPTPVFEAEAWPTVDSDTTDFVSSDEEPNIVEPTRAVVRKGRKKRVFVSDSSSDSEFLVSDKELGDLKESEPPECLKVLPSSQENISITCNGEHKGKEKKEPEEALRATCGICLSQEHRVTMQGVLNCCSHYFCFPCIMQWSKVESRCPLCKQRFTTVTKSSKVDIGLHLTKSVIRVEKRDQVYQPTEEEIRRWLDPYENVVCIECNQGGDDNLMLLCDICDSSAHTYCVGLGREVPEGNWYCGGCRLGGEGHPYHRSPVNGNSGVFGVTASIGTFERQRIDLNVSPREVPWVNHSVESQASAVGASNLSGRHGNATDSRRHQIHGLMRILLSRPRTLRPDMYDNGVQQSGSVPSTEPNHRNFCDPLESKASQNTGSVPRGEPNHNFHAMSEANTPESSIGRHAALSERRQMYERFCMLLSRPSPMVGRDLFHNASEHSGSIPRVEPNHMNFHALPVDNSSQTLHDGISNHSNDFSFAQAHSNFVDGNNFQDTEGV